MKIIDQFIMSKTGNMDDCEDAIIFNDHFACVADGVTSKSKHLWNGLTTGQMGTGLAEEAINQLKPDSTMETAVATINETIAGYYKKHGVYKEMHDSPWDRFAFTMALYSKQRREVWVVGDCQCLIKNTVYNNYLLVEKIVTNARAYVLEIELLKGKSIEELMKDDPGRKAIKPLLESQAILRNADCSNPYCYGAIDGFPLDSKHLQKYHVPFSVKTIVLASDGYPELKPTLKETELYLSHILKTDPLLFREYKATKALKAENVSFDDRAYLKLKV